MSRFAPGAVAMVVLVAVVVGSCAPPAPPRFAFKHTERRGRFANGMRFVLMPDATTEMVEVDVRYDVGSREDPEGKAGLAHLVEHLMFQQRPDGPSSPPLMQSINDLSTSFNAYTTWDATHYMTGARRDSLDALLKIEAMRLFYGCQTVSSDEFLREREVVRNEIRQRGGTAEGQIPQLLLSSIYPKGHAYARPVGGDDRQLSTITLDDACGFIARYYAPERATLIIAGGFDVDAAIAAMEKWFPRIAKRSAAPRIEVKPFTAEHGKVEYALDVERPSVHVVWPMPAAGTPDGEAVRFGLFSTMFRLAGKAAEYDFADAVEPQLLGGELAPAFAISIALKDMANLDEALAFVDKAARSAYRGFDQGTAAQIEESQNRRKAAFIAGLERLPARTNEVADLIQRSDIDFDSQDLYLFHELDQIGKFDGARVAAAIKRYVNFDRARIVVIRPSHQGAKGDARSSVKLATRSDEQIAVTEVDPSDAERPIQLTAAPRGVAGAQRFTLDNGLRAVLLPVKAMPLITARLIFNNAGDAAAPEQPALARFTAATLFPALDADATARTGVRVECKSTTDATICGADGMSIYHEVVIRSLERMVIVGTYDQEGLERTQQHFRRLFGSHERQDAEAEHQELAALYGADHPYTRSGVLTPEAVDPLHLDALVAYRLRHYSAANATLVVVGDFDPGVVEQEIRKSFGYWQRGEVDKPVATTSIERSGPVAVGVVGSDSAQLHIAIAYPAPAGVDAQSAARAVLAEMLNQRVGDLRFKLGSTYGVYARHATHTGPTAYELGGDVDAERGGDSLKAMRDGVAMLRRGDQFAADFVRARRKLVSDLLADSTVTAELAARLGFIAVHDLPPDYYRTLLEHMAAVTPAQIHALIDRELVPSREVVVVTGDKSHLERAFAGAGLTGARIVEPR